MKRIFLLGFLLVSFLIPNAIQAQTTNYTIREALNRILNSPTVVAVSSNNTLFTALDVVRADFSITGPVIGIPADGAQGIMVYATYDSLRGRSHNKFSVRAKFTAAAFDTSSYYFSAGADTFTVDAAVVGSDTGSFTFLVPCPSSLFTGYFYLEVDSWGVITLRNFNAAARVVY